MPSTIGYIDYRKTTINDIVDFLSGKISFANVPNPKEIITKAKNSDKNNRLEALIDIRVFQIKELLDLVIDIMLNDNSSEVRQSAAFTIDHLKDERALPALIKAVHDNAFGVRSAAGWALVHLGNQVIPHMREIIESSNNTGAKEMAHLVLRSL